MRGPVILYPGSMNSTGMGSLLQASVFRAGTTTLLRDPNPVHGAKEDKHLGMGTGQQGHAAIGHCLQHQKIPEILGKTDKKWSGKPCSAQLYGKCTPQVYLPPFWHYKNECTTFV